MSLKQGILASISLVLSAGASELLAREYDPRIGRFLQNDPRIENRASEHYVYARNNPTRYTDPYGEEIRVTGTEDSLSRLQRFLQAATGLQVTLVEERGRPGRRVVLAEGAPTGIRQQALVGQLRRILNDPRSVTVDVVQHDAAVNIDHFATRRLDIGDVIDIHEINMRHPVPANLPSTSAAQHLLHVFDEYVGGWNPPLLNIDPRTRVNLGFGRAHDLAVATENAYRRQLGLAGVLQTGGESLTGVITEAWRPEAVALDMPYEVGTTAYREAYLTRGGRFVRRAIFMRDRDPAGQPTWRFVAGQR